MWCFPYLPFEPEILLFIVDLTSSYCNFLVGEQEGGVVLVVRVLWGFLFVSFPPVAPNYSFP